MMNLSKFALGIVAAFLAVAPMGATAADKAPVGDRLSEVLLPGQDWQVVADNLGFADGASADAEGNFYFSDLKSKPPAVYRISPDGKQTKIADAGMSGTKIGPDGRLYGCGGGKVMAFQLPGGKATTIASGLKTNDIVITHKGFIYITETGKKQVTFVDAKTGQAKAADVGITAPNGIGVTPDQSHLIVSDYNGMNVYSMAIADDGTLSDKKAVITMKAPANKPTVAGGDGLTLDTAGRCYVTTKLGLQIFDAGGQLLGILPNPQPGLTNTALAGPNLQYLYITCGTKVYRRKTQAKGALGYQEPITATQKK
ncbi:MAG TPA: SMP-30/gluconolactonase/LRE family protein [Tepidisphaeraceae bacterium]|jgi:enterochelin esterase family protein|nr:SMP-30/gluconolactonase/LRE family protein [Tepidisphaeraceae bacterium]